MGDLAVSLFVAGAVFGEIWVDSRSPKCNFQYKMRCRGGKVRSANGRVQFCNFMLGSGSDHGRIMVGSTAKSSAIVNGTSTVFGQFLLDCGMQFCVAGAVFGEVGG